MKNFVSLILCLIPMIGLCQHATNAKKNSKAKDLNDDRSLLIAINQAAGKE